MYVYYIISYMHNPKGAFIIIPGLGNWRQTMMTALTFRYPQWQSLLAAPFFSLMVIGSLPIAVFLAVSWVSWGSSCQKHMRGRVLCWIQAWMTKPNMVFSSGSCQEWRQLPGLAWSSVWKMAEPLHVTTLKDGMKEGGLPTSSPARSYYNSGK